MALPPPLGLMGGTFDPVHHAHLRLAEEAAEHLGLARVRWIPSGRPGHRASPGTPGRHRLEMVRIAIRDNPRFELDDAEAESTAPGFTIDTLKRLRGALGADVPLVFIIGADQLHAFHSWRSWRELFTLAHFAVGERPGFPVVRDALPPEVGAEYGARAAPPAALATSSAGRIVAFPMTQLGIAASALRGRLASGRSVRYLLPHEVLAYIRTHGLYLEERPAS
jgi:nicotinate-nucleotide adenylyltransferase